MLRNTNAIVVAKLLWLVAISIFLAASVEAQSVCLPLPRLLTLVPSGGQISSEFEVVIGGEHIDGATRLIFNHPGLIAKPQVDSEGKPQEDRYLVSISDDCPAGVYEARVVSRLGVSSARAFVVGHLPEVVCGEGKVTLEKALALVPNTVCNASVSAKAIDYYKFNAEAGKRYVIRCMARGIDSKLDPVLLLADDQGRDLVADRLGAGIDWVAETSGTHTIKIHDLTFNGGSPYYYRLELLQVALEQPVEVMPSTRAVAAFSWPPLDLPEAPKLLEREPNNTRDNVQRIELPCDLGGSFYPAADVDIYEFAAKAGEEWWVEVASDRLGRPTDPHVLVQRVIAEGSVERLEDVAELIDIASPVKPSSNGYAYDGPPYNGGSLDVLGKFVAKADGLHRLVVSDLFGGTRNDRQNTYRLIVRRAAPDFALAGWGLHMELRNGDRNALSKPIALRAGGTVVLEVVAVRRDGFDGPIDLEMSGLPPGVSAVGLRIPAGKNRGFVLVSAAEGAPQDWSEAKLEGVAMVDSRQIRRPIQMGQVAWPIPDSWGEIPRPRLVCGVPVSVTQSEVAPLSIEVAEEGILEAEEGAALAIPLRLTKRSEFSGSVLQLRTLGEGFEGNPRTDIALDAANTEITIDLAKLKTPPGQYTIAFYAPAVAKYQLDPQAVYDVQQRLDRAMNTSTVDEGLVKRLNEELKRVTERAKPRDTVDIVVSQPIHIRVTPKANS